VDFCLCLPASAQLNSKSMDAHPVALLQLQSTLLTVMVPKPLEPIAY